MDLDKLSQIVIIILGIIQSIYYLWLISVNGKGRPLPPSKTTQIVSREVDPLHGEDASSPPSPATKLFFALCIVLFLFGALSILYSTVNLNLDKERCLQGYDPSYYKIIKTCEEYANSRQQETIRIGMLSIGISFVLSTVGLFIQKFRKATLPQYVLVILWLVFGVWLIVSNL